MEHAKSCAQSPVLTRSLPVRPPSRQVCRANHGRIRRGQKNLAAGLGASSSETSASIGLRTQTITLLRDGLYRLCEAYMNGAVDEIQYMSPWSTWTS